MKALRSLGKTLFPLTLLIITPGLRAQETVTLYLEPNTSGYVVDTLPADDPRLEYATEMGSNTDQPLIWKMFELDDTFEGYVDKGEVTKGLTVIPGALVYFKPEKESAFLTVVQTDNEVQVLGVENDWVQISLTASLPVYFQAKAAEEVQETEPEPAQESAATEVASERHLPPSSLAGEQVPGVRRSVALTPPRTKTGLPLDRELEGRLRRLPKTGLFARTKYDWELVDLQNKRIAFVDPSNLILTRPLDNLEGRRVILSGALSELEDGRNMLFVVRQIVAQ